MRNRDRPATGFGHLDSNGRSQRNTGLTKREEAAIKIAAGIVANASLLEWTGKLTEELRMKDGEAVAMVAVVQADALFDKLDGDASE